MRRPSGWTILALLLGAGLGLLVGPVDDLWNDHPDLGKLATLGLVAAVVAVGLGVGFRRVPQQRRRHGGSTGRRPG